MDPMRLILIAIGGYLVYKATVGKAAAVPPATGGGTVPGGSGGTATPGTGGSTPTPNTPGGTNPPVNNADAFYAALWNETPSEVSKLSAPFDNGKDYVMARGAVGDQAAINVLMGHNVLQGPDQWNVYHVLGGAPVIDPSVMDAYIAGDRSPISVTEYRARLGSASLSGLGMGSWGGEWA